MMCSYPLLTVESTAATGTNVGREVTKSSDAFWKGTCAVHVVSKMYNISFAFSDKVIREDCYLSTNWYKDDLIII